MPRTERLRRLALRVLLLVLTGVTGVVIPVATQAGPSQAAAPTFSNPVASAPYGADPWMGYYNGNYYLATTTWNSQVVIKKASSVAGLASAPANVVYTGSGTDACCNMWAPDLHLLDGPNGRHWYLYLTLGPAGCCGGQRSYVLESAGTDPLGSYRMKGKLRTLPGDGFSIDGSVLSLGGSNYFMFSAFGSDQRQDLFIAPMSNPWTLSAYGTQISSPTLSWETAGNPVNEAPFAVHHGSDTFISYSASSCTTANYAVGLLRYNGGPVLDARSWVKQSRPLMSSNPSGSVYAPGGQGFFSSPDGSQTWIVYHANESSSQGCGPTRTTRVQPVTWTSSGLPATAAPSALSANLAVPQGDPGGGGDVVNPGTRYRLVNQNSGRVLDARNCGRANGTAIQQWDSLGNSCQQWTFTRTSSGYYTITNVNSGTVLDSVNCGAGNGTALNLWQSLGNACQQWSVTPISGHYLIANRANGLVLDVANCGTSNGTAVRQWTALGNPCQQWTLTEADSAGQSSSTPGVVKGNVQVHDPSMVRGPDGTYVLVSTAPGIGIRTSADRTTFTYRGVAFPDGAPWTDQYTHASNGNLWAPDISYHDGRFWLYYAASSFGSNTSAIFLATSASGLPGTWTNRGSVYSTTSSSSFNAIDPNLYVASDGRWWLTFGSFWAGIEQIELNPSSGLPLGGGVSNVAARPGSTAVEAPFVFAHGGSYYLFTSWDQCCQGASSTYRIMVGRSASPRGPFTDRAGKLLVSGGGTQILATNGRYAGPGGQSVMSDAGADILVYHYYDAADRGTAKLGINLLGWTSDGWPYVH